jgi:quercetin dioxygenase-like cupin family protein
MIEIIFLHINKIYFEIKEKAMKNIHLIKEFDLQEKIEIQKEVKEIFNGSRRRLVEVKLAGGAVLPKHKAAEPITIFCLAGSGVFRAGKDLEEEQTLRAGTLLTLEGGVEHEVVAESELRLLVSKFKEV